MAYAIETVAVAPQAQGYRHIFMAAASQAAAQWHVDTQEKARGFDARVIEVTDAEHAAILKGERNGWLPTNKLPELA